MPLYWKIDSKERLVTASAEGAVAASEFLDCLDAMRGANVFAYRRLFDLSDAVFDMASHEVMDLAVRVREYYVEGVSGALAIVVPDGKFPCIGRLLGILAAARRPLRVFPTHPRALTWIMQQDDTRNAVSQT